MTSLGHSEVKLIFFFNVCGNADSMTTGLVALLRWQQQLPQAHDSLVALLRWQ